MLTQTDVQSNNIGKIALYFEHLRFMATKGKFAECLQLTRTCPLA